MLKKVTDTARELMAFKAETSTIPFAEEVAHYFKIETDPALKKTFGFWASVLHFEMRSRSLDYFLELNQCPHVVELSAGFSFRGLAYKKKNPQVTYYDTDLEEIMMAKSKIITDLSVAVPQNLKSQPLNVLNLREFPAILGEVLLLNEGLLLYFNTNDQRAILRNLHHFLSERGGSWVTADIYIKHDTTVIGSDQDKKWDKFFDKNKVQQNYFESFDQAAQFFYDNGFEIVQKYTPEFDKLSSLPQLLAHASTEQLDMLRNKGSIQQTWQVKTR